MRDIPFDRLYAQVPTAQRGDLREFRRAHPLKTVQVKGTTWEYLASGQGDQVILLLVGGMRVADAAFHSIQRLEPDFRVITPTYPALDTMAQLAAGLAGVLDAEGISAAHVLSGSFGGMLALQLVRDFPQRSGKLILSSTAIPGADEAAAYRKMDRIFSRVPSRLARAVMKRRLFQIVAPPPEEYAFWKAYFDELFGYRVNKAELLSTLRCIVDFARTAPTSPDDLAGWSGETLLLASDDDHTFGEAAQRALRHVLPPRVEVHTFHGAGHSPAMTQPEAFFGTIKQFLA
jgi:pimeloyl-ACP methyl ester carboxylesterase